MNRNASRSIRPDGFIAVGTVLEDSRYPNGIFNYSGHASDAKGEYGFAPRLGKCKRFIIIPILFISVLFGVCGCGARCGAVFVSNNAFTVGAYTADNDVKPCSSVLIGIPGWHDNHTKICGAALSPLYHVIDEMNGVSVSLFGMLSRANGIQFGGVGILSGNTGGAVVAPVSFVGSGDCLQLGLIAANGVGRGSSGVSGQIALWNHAHESAVNGPKIQIGTVNTDFSYRDDTPKKNFQIGLVNYVGHDQNNADVNRRCQFGIVNFYHDDYRHDVENEISLVQIGLLNFRNRKLIPLYFR